MADLADIRHRLCGTTLLDPGGCDICEPVKGDLVIDDGSTLDVLATSKRAVALLTVILGRLEGELKVAGKKEYQKHWAKDAAIIASALSRVVGEYRKYEADSALQVEGFSEQQKLDLMVHWVKGLPNEQKYNILSKIQSSLEQRVLLG